MIQEKDFLYRVPVKTAPITTPGGQIRNPEILVDLEGGEFMHGNILDANSTSKFVNQSVKEAVDNKLIESGYVTKDLLDAETTRATEQENNLKTLIGAETSARTKGDEDLSSKIKAEQTRAEGKEKEISDKLAIVNGDSNTEGSFRKAIADVVAAAPEDLDTLKEIADKLAGNDDLHTALNQAITEKADASALANEVSRATGVESGLQAAIATKADATALSNYVLTTALNKQVDTLNAAISAKQDAGNYMAYVEEQVDRYKMKKALVYQYDNGFDSGSLVIGQMNITMNADNDTTRLDGGSISFERGNEETRVTYDAVIGSIAGAEYFVLNKNGLKLKDGDDNHVLTSNASTIDITQYAKKSEIAAGGNVDDVQVNGVTVVENKIANIKPATKESLGVVKVGDGLNVTDGTISVDSTAIGTGNYIPYKEIFDSNTYILPYNYNIGCRKDTKNGNYDSVIITPQALLINKDKVNAAEGVGVSVTYNELLIKGGGAESVRKFLSLDSNGILLYRNYGNEDIFRLDQHNLKFVNYDESYVKYGIGGIVASQYQNCLATSDGAFKPISDFVLKTELPTVPTKVSQLQNDSEFITKSVYDEKIAALEARIAALEAKHQEATA